MLKAGAEFLNIWREDSTECYAFDAIAACVDKNVYERPYAPNTSYLAYQDAASGGGDNAFALAITHRDPGTDIAVLDLLRERKPPFVAYEVIAEWAKILKSYNIAEIWGDSYAFKLFADEWRKHGIIARKAGNTTSENFLHGLPLVLGARLRLLDNTTLCNQLLSLERYVVDGREGVDHPKIANAHDDVAAAAIGALVTISTRSGYTLDPFQPGFVDRDAPPQPVNQPEPPQCNGNWWKSMPRSPPTYSANERLRGLYQSIDFACKSGFFR